MTWQAMIDAPKRVKDEEPWHERLSPGWLILRPLLGCTLVAFRVQQDAVRTTRPNTTAGAVHWHGSPGDGPAKTHLAEDATIPNGAALCYAGPSMVTSEVLARPVPPNVFKALTTGRTHRHRFETLWAWVYGTFDESPDQQKVSIETRLRATRSLDEAAAEARAKLPPVAGLWDDEA